MVEYCVYNWTLGFQRIPYMDGNYEENELIVQLRVNWEHI